MEYKERFKTEYYELETRIQKLETILIKNECDTLTFKLNSPSYVLRDQLEAMKTYLHCLKMRAEYEKIEL